MYVLILKSDCIDRMIRKGVIRSLVSRVQTLTKSDWITYLLIYISTSFAKILAPNSYSIQKH